MPEFAIVLASCAVCGAWATALVEIVDDVEGIVFPTPTFTAPVKSVRNEFESNEKVISVGAILLALAAEAIDSIVVGAE
jgi:PHP family Zn ribbon phosphoesterase